MNYFELFDLPISFSIDSIQLRSAFMNIQRASHPDKFAQGTELEQETALEQSALANKGFSLLGNKDLLMPYVLEITGTINPDEKYNLAPEFLMEMMEFNESWMEAENEADKQNIINQVNDIKNEILSPIKSYLESKNVHDIPLEGMLQIKDYYYKKKYLDRILEDFHH